MTTSIPDDEASGGFWNAGLLDTNGSPEKYHYSKHLC